MDFCGVVAKERLYAMAHIQPSLFRIGSPTMGGNCSSDNTPQYYIEEKISPVFYGGEVVDVG